jgi:hypothetical protein
MTRRPGLALGLALVVASLGAGCSVPVPPCDIVIASSDAPDVDRIAPDAVILATAADVDPTGWSVVGDDDGLQAVNLRLKPEAAERFAEHTAANVGGFLAIAVNDVVVSTPSVMGPIEGGEVTISGGGDDDVVEAFRPCLPIEIRPPA